MYLVIISVYLAMGSWRISKKNVLARKSQSVENLGAVTVLCSDKTGLLYIMKNLIIILIIFIHIHINIFIIRYTHLEPDVTKSFIHSSIYILIIKTRIDKVGQNTRSNWS